MLRSIVRPIAAARMLVTLTAVTVVMSTTAAYAHATAPSKSAGVAASVGQRTLGGGEWG